MRQERESARLVGSMRPTNKVRHWQVSIRVVPPRQISNANRVARGTLATPPRKNKLRQIQLRRVQRKRTQAQNLRNFRPRAWPLAMQRRLQRSKRQQKV